MPSKYTQAETFRKLEKMGVATAVVGFSGGNDEGQIEYIDLLDKDGERIGQVESHWANYVTDENGQPVMEKRWDPVFNRNIRRPKTIPLTEEQESENKLHDALSMPVEVRYGSFAGDFHVTGSFSWLVKQRKIIEQGSESVYQDYEHEFNYGEVF